MPISNSSPQQKDVVIIQRNSTNEYYGETHISGSKLIFYTDSSGYINADESASFYTIFPPPETGGLTPGSTYQITSSWAISSSWASQSLSASCAPVEPAYSASISIIKQNTLITSETYTITSSWSNNSITASSISFVPLTTTSAECQQFMSASDCMTLFNVCDPVICPASRCDLGGQYRVDNVIQSGIIGSLTLCLSNFRE